jgi:hypothetical protein
MTKREFRRLRAGNLVQEAFFDSLWIVVERRRRNGPCLILARAKPGREEAALAAKEPSLGDAWAVPEDYSATLRRLA